MVNSCFMDLLTNAIESIQVGVEDYLAGTRPRLLSAVRNIHAGILLLYKEALRRESPKDSDDVLIMAKIAPARDAAGNVVFVGKGKRTVDVPQIEERFRALGVETDWKRLRRISDVRNDVEHRPPQVDQKALEGLISDSFLIVRNFIKEELDDDPLELLGDKTWRTMLDVSEVYQREKQECERLIAESKWTSPTVARGVADLICQACGGDLLKPAPDSYGEIILHCISCGKEQSPDAYVPLAVALALSAEAYSSAKDGGESPYAICPECGAEAYVMEEDRCAVCGNSVERECMRCGESIPAEELDSSPLCGYCSHMMNKDD
jgi:ribosomal protein L37E